MTFDSSYIVITPVRNEGRYFSRTIESVVAQTKSPATWYIVDDGSTDDTRAIADAAALKHSWIKVIVRPDRGFRQPGSGVIEAFYEALAAIENQAWGFLVKLDGDLVFGPDYFQRCLEHFEQVRGICATYSRPDSYQAPR